MGPANLRHPHTSPSADGITQPDSISATATAFYRTPARKNKLWRRSDLRAVRLEVHWLDGLFPSDTPSELGKGTQCFAGKTEDCLPQQDLAALHDMMVPGALLMVMEHPTLLESSQKCPKKSILSIFSSLAPGP